MYYTKEEALAYLRENDVKFVKCAFCDAAGKLRNISVLASRAEELFLHGVRFDASFVSGFAAPDLPDLWLLPDPSTMTVLPWRPTEGRVVRVFCEIVDGSGTPVPFDCRRILAGAARAARDAGVFIRMGAMCEFYLFRIDEFGNPTRIPADHAGFMDVFPADGCENVRRDIDLTLEQMGIMPESSHHECGPGQNEIDFAAGDPLTAADQLVLFCNVVASVAAKYGLSADFSPLPIPDEAGNGLHIAFSVRPLLPGAGSEGLDSCNRAFMAGIMEHIREITAFLNPVSQSYHRFGKYKAPRRIGYSECNRDQLIKLHRPASEGIPDFTVTSPDPTANPYLAFALLIYAGLDGIRRGLSLDPALEVASGGADPCPPELLLPNTLREAEQLMRESKFVKNILPPELASQLMEAYRAVK